MSVHEFSGKTTEEAINQGLEKLGVTISDVKVEVLDEGNKGLFGVFGSKQARVRMTLEEAGSRSIDDLLNSLSSLDGEAEKKQQKAKPEKKPEPVKQQRPKAEQEKPAPQKKKVEKPKAETPVAPVAATLPADLPTPELRDPGTPAGVAQQFLMQLTQLMHVPVAVEADTDEEGNVRVQMTGDTLGILIGRRGETLDALQYLTSLHVNKGRDGYIRVTLDTENYRAKREEALGRLAARMAGRAVKTRRRVSMEPMNPYERRILHSALQGHPHVTTHSEGEEPNRHVVIVLKETANSAEVDVYTTDTDE